MTELEVLMHIDEVLSIMLCLAYVGVMWICFKALYKFFSMFF